MDLEGIPSRIPTKEAKKTAIFFGAISLDKGISDALKIFSLLYKKDNNWQFWIAGRAAPDMKDYLHSESKKLNIDKNIKYFGYVSEKKKFDLLARAHFLVNTSIREGWGLVNIEANAVGTPIAGYKVAGMKDSVVDKKTGILCKIGDIECVAKSIDEIVKKDIYESYSRNCLQWSKKFNWKKSTKESTKFIENLIEHKSS